MLIRTTKSTSIARTALKGLALLVLLSSGNACLVLPAAADTFKLGVQEAEAFKQAEIVSAPEPVISSELKEECLKTCCVARFAIEPTGKFKVNLIASSGSAEVDEITMSCLRGWKFKPAQRGSEPVASTRKIRVEFTVD